MVADKDLAALISIMEDIAEGNYSNDIMAFTAPEVNEPIRRMAEAMAMMMVKVEAREMRLEALVDELRDLNKKLKRNTVKTVSAMANSLAARDVYTEGHAWRVAEYTARLSRRIGLEEEKVEQYRLGGVLHDIGKIGFSDRIFQHEDLNISEEMLAEIQQHPEIGGEIIKDLVFLKAAIGCVLYHHERLDGTGYPYGLKDEQIPLGARILAVTDCFDALTTDRPYQKGKTVEEACGILRRLAEKALSRDLVEAFIEEIMENGTCNYQTA